MSPRQNSLILVFFLMPAAVFAADNLFVQSVKVDLRDSPRLDGKKVVELKRGDELVQVEKQGVWIKAKVNGGATGWVSRLFLSTSRPVGEAELRKDIPTNLEKTNRRRSSSYAVSASSRGLMSDERTREGRSLYRTDFDSVDALENYTVPESKVTDFEKSAKLGDGQ